MKVFGYIMVEWKAMTVEYTVKDDVEDEREREKIKWNL